MAYSNSSLVTYTALSPNHSGLRTHAIDTITPHCVVGHLSLQTLGAIFLPASRKASSNYGIDDKGSVGMYVEEKNRSWCTSSNSNDQRAVTIEIASDKTSPHKITDHAMQGLINLCTDICIRNNIPKLLWKADKSLIGQVAKQNITVHRWFTATECPGDYIYSQLGVVATEVNKLLLPKPSGTISTTPVYTDTASPDIPFRVKVNTAVLFYRGGPGKTYPIRGRVTKGQVFTIVATSSGTGGAALWGKLKSGAGWIALDYCVKLR